MKRRSLLLATPALILTAPAMAQAPAMVDEVKKRGVLRSGLSTFVPWAMRDRNGGLIGFELDVARRLAEDWGVKHEPVPTAWDGIIPALLAGNFDAIIGGMTVTPQREASVDFTEAYSFTGVHFAANRKVAPGLTAVEGLNKPNITLAARRGTNAATVVQQQLPLATLRQFDDDAQALQEVLNGNAAAWFTSTPKPAFAVLDNPDTLYLPVAKPIVGQRDAMAVRKGDAKSVAALNEWIAARKADGFLAERFSYWFEKRDWRALVQS